MTEKTKVKCCIDGCTSPARIKRYQLCGAHYQQKWTRGQLVKPAKAPKPTKPPKEKKPVTRAKTIARPATGTKRGTAYAWLLDSPSPKTTMEMAERMNSPVPSARKMLCEMALDGFVERMTVPGDQRVYWRALPIPDHILTAEERQAMHAQEWADADEKPFLHLVLKPHEYEPLKDVKPHFWPPAAVQQEVQP